MALPFSLLFGDWTTFLDNNGLPLDGGTLSFYVAGTTTPQHVYGKSDGSVDLGPVVTLNASGRPSSSGSPTGVYLSATGYKLVLADVLGNPIVTQDNIEDIGQVFLQTLASQQTAGAKNQTSYTSTNADCWITMNGGALALQDVTLRVGLPLVVQSIGSGTVAITPNGSQTINGNSGVYTLAAASSPSFPAVWLYQDSTSASNWLATVTS